MKKIVLALLLLLLTSCSKEDEPQKHTFSVNVYYTYSDYESYGEKVADKTFVALYVDNGNGIDVDKINTFDHNLYDTDGNELEIKYVSNTMCGINNFVDVDNGKYVVLVVYSPSTFVRYYTFKKINVNSDYAGKTEKFVFDCSSDHYYQPWM